MTDDEDTDVTGWQRGAHAQTLATPSRSRLRWILLALTPILIGTAFVIALPHVQEAIVVVRALGSTALIAAGAASLAEAVSLTAASRATQILLHPAGPPFRHVLGVDLMAQGVRSIMPGGAATSAGVRITLLQRLGVTSSAAASAATTGVVASNLVLSAIFLLGLALTAGSAGSPIVDGAATMVVLLVLASIIGVWLLLRKPEKVRDAAVRWTRPVRRVLHRPTDRTVAEYVDALGTGLGRLRSPPLAGALLGWVLLNWTADFTAFVLMVSAAGAHVPWQVSLLTYGLVNILATIPVTPGAIGVVEGAAIASLHLAGAPTAVALVGVLGWRIVEYWLPLAAAVVATPMVLIATRRRPARSSSRGTLGTLRWRWRPRRWLHGHRSFPPHRTVHRR
ncbi:lysylphosphatidylglycerol synthase transmembrane domain-containing protein [Curtobacterium sp. PhB115]|uniref:lysylphosphatidylglycerol synthase transmembrane domain-containing protein n=1 Tax=Curtobacterium sp. PhB115 TaxID=2485173 RepID=UPI000F9A766B|nr:lysylphosphatidylglycerol synthase transmembrane domain-containing protein [Curtobacterium sp. PhB115]ROP58651.1 uncharacterized protein (TIRG00374 family) [Curtobacterium sp. PhB115]